MYKEFDFYAKSFGKNAYPMNVFFFWLIWFFKVNGRVHCLGMMFGINWFATVSEISLLTNFA
jgi:hypothetical protein